MKPRDWLVVIIVMMLPVFGSFFFVHFDRFIDRFVYGLITILLGDVDKIAINIQEATLSREHRTLQGGGDVQHRAPCSVDGSEQDAYSRADLRDLWGASQRPRLCHLLCRSSLCICCLSHGLLVSGWQVSRELQSLGGNDLSIPTEQVSVKGS